MSEQTQLSHKNAIKPLIPHRKAFLDTHKLPWTNWVMEGTYFKLLNINEMTGGFTIMLKVDPGIEAPVHHHIGGIEAYVTEGEFGYGDDDRGGVGSYVLEASGSIHQPDSPDGTTMFAIAHGPLVGYNEDGSIAVVVDARLMYEMAKANNAADHIQIVNTFHEQDD
ncbi:2,4'-dihydroxyacetophenone dioxygenase family protein [Luteithermobacter gelatinilyticus]|uniref:2,4'-dihydroxyacetophenone dioxygenase family protein n=1 Tax=Luteithermobacter gelatinilyticus TaxID=2582913 RepID=UPI001106F8A4|nr:2,4'-dihydroxyacetophenone dioxygenase family protein [Luteithermobacter gelatinilyticus]